MLLPTKHVHNSDDSSDSDDEISRVPCHSGTGIYDEVDIPLSEGDGCPLIPLIEGKLMLKFSVEARVSKKSMFSIVTF